jgi:protein-S-isoprenylcysteine O-methyltransferase Ste14
MQHVRPRCIAGYSFGAGMAAGSGALLLAVALAAWGIWEMKRHRTPIEPGQIPARLVTTGPFRFSRNPLYLALLLVLAGLAVMGNSLWLGLGTGVLLLLLDRLVVRREEAAIRRTFGPEYSAYVTRVRRWF